MKKIIVVSLIAIIALLALAACGTKPAEAPAAAELPNPWSDYETAAAAAQNAGVDELALPENGVETPTGGRVDWIGYRAMKGLAEADGYVGSAELTARKGLKESGADLSGDYNRYAFTWTQQVDGMTVTSSGNEEGRAMKAVWQDGAYSYSLTVRGQGDIHDTYGVDAETLAFLVRNVK